MLRNTRWVVGLVLNTGLDTKIMMSMSEVCVSARGGGGGRDCYSQNYYPSVGPYNQSFDVDRKRHQNIMF